MHQGDFYREVARALGEPVSVIRRIGFVPADPAVSTSHSDADPTAAETSATYQGGDSHETIGS